MNSIGPNLLSKCLTLKKKDLSRNVGGSSLQMILIFLFMRLVMQVFWNPVHYCMSFIWFCNSILPLDHSLIFLLAPRNFHLEL